MAQLTSMATGAVAVVNGAAPDYDLLEALLAERIQEIDLAQHILRVALPQPGDESELFRAIAHALERPLDLDRPPWECWLIEGLTENRWAILMKVHHSMADGISAAHLLTRLCDNADNGTFVDQAVTTEVAQQVCRSQIEVRSWTDALWQAHTNVLKAATRAVTWPATWMLPPSPDATMRRYRTVRVSRAAVDSVSRKFGVTTNDVALAAITEGFRSVLLRRGEQPRADSLRTLEKIDGRISAMLPYLPVEHDDPVQQLQTVHTRLNTQQSNQRQTTSISDFLPHALCAKAIQTLTRLAQQGTVTLATNVSGPRHRLRLMGQRMDQMLPIPPTALQLSTGVAVLSYADELIFGITADYDAAPDMEQLAAGIELGMARLVALSQDSVLLFTKNRRKRTSRAMTGSSLRWRPSAPHARARR